MIRWGIVAHGGVGSSAEHRDGPQRAVEVGARILRGGGSALEAVVEAAAILENDGRFNAGVGSALRLDGRTQEMDAAVMTSDGRLGAVACVGGVPNPVRLARRVMETPHHLLAGEGARRLAERFGLTGPVRPTEQAVRRHAETLRRLRGDAGWKNFDLAAYWNFDRPADEALGCDTIGAVALDASGLLAAANSTGGASPMLAGRVGDSPLIGCGFFCGPAAAVITTGLGERIIEAQLARWVYDRITFGESVERAAALAVERFGAAAPIGVQAIARRGWASSHNRDMAWASELVTD
jgi:L-asparaginase/beta-aspartyl-peptidase (threonine type)